MSALIKGSETLDAIQQVFKTEGDIYAAVAYWNGNAAKRLRKMAGKNLHVVLDVNAGGTSPRDLKYLRKHLGENVKVHPNLHTKIYASKDLAVVGSSNASKPGLHLTPTTRVEASVLVDGEAAAAAFAYAKELFDEAELATTKHVKICEQRFMKKSLAEAEAVEGKVDFLTPLWERRDLMDEIPLILTNEEIEPERLDEALKAISAKHAGGEEEGKGLDLTDLEPFDWKFDEMYDGQLCIAVHNPTKGGMQVALVRPITTISDEMTFARFLPWSDLEFLNYRDSGYRPIKGEKLVEFRAKVDEKMLSEGFIRIKDLGL